MAELVTWCRIFAVGLPCARPCEDCRLSSRAAALAGQAGGGVLRWPPGRTTSRQLDADGSGREEAGG